MTIEFKWRRKMKKSMLMTFCLLLVFCAALILSGCLEESTPSGSDSASPTGTNQDDDDDLPDDDDNQGDDDGWDDDREDGEDDDREDDDREDDEDWNNCEAVCDKLIDCGQWDEGDDQWAECMEFCEEEMNPDDEFSVGDCILEVECEEIDECWEEEEFEPECDLYCAKLIGCDSMPWWEFEECVEGCYEEPPELIECVIETECDAIEEECYEESWPEDMCDLYCDKMVDCDYFHPMFWDLCFDTCLDESEELIECVIDVECEEIESACFE